MSAAIQEETFRMVSPEDPLTGHCKCERCSCVLAAYCVRVCPDGCCE